MIDTSKKLSLLINRMLPSFVMEEYPKFADFITLFLEYIEREKGEYDIVANLLNYNDIDNTLSDFEILFKEEFIKSFPASITGDVDLLVKNIRDFYKSKGTEDSFRFLFSNMFDSDVQFFYPKFHILKASDGIWYRPEFLLFSDLDDNIPPLHNSQEFNVSNLVGKYIIGIRSGAESYVENITNKLYSGSLEKFVEIAEREGSFIESEMIVVGSNHVYNGNFSALESGWYQSHSDDYFYVEDGQYHINQPITGNDERYIYQEMSFTDFGLYHLRYSIESSDGLAITVKIGYAENSGDILTVTLPGSATFPYRDFIPIPSFNINEKIFITIVSNLASGKNMVIDGIGVIKESEDYPFFKIVTNGIVYDDYKWADTRGWLSSDMYLQDNYYYQDYSYVLKTGLSRDKYSSIIEENVHPSGYIMFGDVRNSDDNFIGAGLGNILNLAEDIILDLGLYSTYNVPLQNNELFERAIIYEISTQIGVTYEYVEYNRENDVVNKNWDNLTTFENIQNGEFENTPTERFIYMDSFDVIIT